MDDRIRRINIKSKRRKNIFKKAMEFKSMCGLDILMVIKDPDYNNVQIYNFPPDVSFPEVQFTQLLKDGGT